MLRTSILFSNDFCLDKFNFHLYIYILSHAVVIYGFCADANCSCLKDLCLDISGTLLPGFVNSFLELLCIFLF